MDKYKELFDKGANAYIEVLISIEWFDNLYVDKDKIISDIKSCKYPPYFATYLEQWGLMVDVGYDEDYFTDLMNGICQFIPNSSYYFMKDEEEFYIVFTIGENVYDIKIDFNEFVFGKGDDGDCFLNYFINTILEKEQSEYRFYEMPPDDETGSYIFVKPETYQKALDLGVIPDCMGYYAVMTYEVDEMRSPSLGVPLRRTKKQVSRLAKNNDKKAYIKLIKEIETQI